MKRWIKKLLIKLSKSARVQHLLEANLALSRDLMGIGSGGVPESSGESVLIENLKRQYAAFRRPLCIFDVGANQGQFLRMILPPLEAAGIPFHAHVFEPSRRAYEMLCNNIEARRNLVLNNFGLGKEPGDFDLFYDHAGSGLASLSRRRLDHFGIDFGRSEKVMIRVLDEYCGQHGIQTIDLLKLDVEGHELDVLNGAPRMFRERRIKTVSFEFGGCNIDSRTFFQDFWYFFQACGMGRIYRVTPSGRLVAIRQYTEIHEQFATTNFVALDSETQI